MKKIVFLFMMISFVVSSNAQNLKSFYVSPDGNDSSLGSEKSPWRSFSRAVKGVKDFKASNASSAVDVVFSGGEYYVSDSILITGECSGSKDAPVRYIAKEGELPVFCASVALTKWSVLKDEKTLSKLPVESRGKVIVCDIPRSVTDLGDPVTLGLRPELFCNTQTQTLSRWPNDSFTFAAEIQGEPLKRADYQPWASCSDGKFKYKDDRISSWVQEEQVAMGGYWYWDWSEEFHLADVNKDDSLITIKPPYHVYGYKSGLRFFGMNLMCEIDNPGEYFISRKDRKIYWYPRGNVDIKTAEIRLSVLSAPFMLSIKDCSYVTFSGLAFKESRGSAISIRGGDNCLIDNCVIERFGKDAMYISGGFSHGITRSFLKQFGCSGISIEAGDRKELIPANHFIENNIISDFSMFKRTYQPAILMKGIGLRIAHNRLSGCPSSALRLDANDITVEYNEFINLVEESDDQGAIDMWYDLSYRGIVIRYNYWSDIVGGTNHGAAAVRFDDMISGAEVYGNIFNRCGSRNFGAVQIHGGKDNYVYNNIFYDCHAAVSFSAWGAGGWKSALDRDRVKKKIYEDVDVKSEKFTTKYPSLKRINVDPDKNFVFKNIIINCDENYLREYGQNYISGNFEIEKKDRDLKSFCNKEFLDKYALDPIPFDRIGVKDNKYNTDINILNF